MSELQTRYGLTEEQIKNMAKDGWLNRGAMFHDEIYCAWKQIRQEPNTGPEDVVLKVAARFNISRTTVYNILDRFK